MSEVNKLDKLQERALRHVYNDQSSDFNCLSDRSGYTLSDRRMRNMMILVHKCIHNCAPEFLKNIFSVRDNVKNLMLRLCKYSL